MAFIASFKAVRWSQGIAWHRCSVITVYWSHFMPSVYNQLGTKEGTDIINSAWKASSISNAQRWKSLFPVTPFISWDRPNGGIRRCGFRFESRFSESPFDIYLLKVNNRNNRTRCEIYSKLTIKTPERHYWRRSGVFNVNFEHISHFFWYFYY